MDAANVPPEERPMPPSVAAWLRASEHTEVVGERGGTAGELSSALNQAAHTEAIRHAGITARLRMLILHGDSQTMEFWSAIALITWGLWVLYPGWDAINAAPAYAVLETISPHDVVWGALVGLLGAFQMGGLLVRHPRWRKTGAFSAALAWWGLFLAVLLSGWQGPSTAVVGSMATGAIWANLRLTLDRRAVVPRVG